MDEKFKKWKISACMSFDQFLSVLPFPSCELVQAIVIFIDVNCILCNSSGSFFALFGRRILFLDKRDAYKCIFTILTKIIKAWHNNYNKGQGSFSGFGLFDLLPPLFLSYPSALQFHFWVFATIVIKVAHTIHVDRKIQHACHGNPNGVDHHRAQSMCICSWGKFMHVQCVHCVVLVALNHLQFEFLYRIYNVCVWC